MSKLSELLEAVARAPELEDARRSDAILEYLEEKLAGSEINGYLVGYKPAALVREAEDEVGIAALSDECLFEFIVSSSRKRYDVTPLRHLSWFKLDEKKQIRPDGASEPLVKLEAVFGPANIIMQIEASGEKAEPLKRLAKLLHRYLLAQPLDAVTLQA